MMGFKKSFLLAVVGIFLVTTVLRALLLIQSFRGSPPVAIASFMEQSMMFQCRSEPFVTFQPRSRLGNKICEYVHLLHISKTHNISAANHPEMYRALRSIFPNMSAKPVSLKCINEKVYGTMQLWDAHDALAHGMKRSLMIEGAPCRVTAFLHLRSLWMTELRFFRHLEVSADKRLSAMVANYRPQQPPSKTLQQVTVVGVHVRRGDFQSLLDRWHSGELLPPAYYQAAFEYYRRKFGSVVFVVLTEPNERKWCSENLAQGVTDVVVMDDDASQEQDLALLASFSHFVYSHGTFGLWGILLARDLKTIAYPAQMPLSPGQKRYSHHFTLDKISRNWTNVDFVHINF